jgi:hypothetical protein
MNGLIAFFIFFTILKLSVLNYVDLFLNDFRFKFIIPIQYEIQNHFKLSSIKTILILLLTLLLIIIHLLIPIPIPIPIHLPIHLPILIPITLILVIVSYFEVNLLIFYDFAIIFTQMLLFDYLSNSSSY